MLFTLAALSLKTDTLQHTFHENAFLASTGR